MRITLATALVMQAIGAGHCHGFEIVDVTGYPTGTVYEGMELHTVVAAIRMVDHDAQVPERLGHDPDVLDLGHIREAAALAREAGRGQHLEGRVLGPGDLHRAVQDGPSRHAEDLPRDGLRDVLPVERSWVSHGS